jgi:hypothetical protein
MRALIGKSFDAIFLSFLMILTPLSNAFLVGNLIQQPKVFTQSFAKSIEVEGEEFNVEGFGKVTEYSNGTKLVELSATIENISAILDKIRINLTKIVQPNEFSASSVYFTQSSPVQSYYTGPLQEYTWDGLYFVLAPGNSTIWVKYDHNNNYWRYYPLEWNRRWEMQGYEKLHTHMAVSDVYDWYTGAKSDEEIMAKYVKGTRLGINIIGIALAALITLKFGSSVLGIILDAVVAALVLLFNWLLEVLGISNKSQWIQNVVMAEQGDGFFWSWEFHTTGVDAWMIEPPIWYIGPGLSWDVYQRDLETLAQYHTIDVVMHETREFYRTWGSQRDASPETLTTELWYELTLPAGVLTDYGFYGCYK